MAALGLRQTIVTVRWLPSDPLGLGEEALLEATVAAAGAAGLEVVFAVYPYPPTGDREPGSRRRGAFAAWLDALARRYPAGAAVRRRERAEPARLLATAVRQGEAGLRRGASARSSPPATTR